MDDNKNTNRSEPENLPQTPNVNNDSDADDIDDVIKVFHKDRTANTSVPPHSSFSFSAEPAKQASAKPPVSKPVTSASAKPAEPVKPTKPAESKPVVDADADVKPYTRAPMPQSTAQNAPQNTASDTVKRADIPQKPKSAPTPSVPTPTKVDFDAVKPKPPKQNPPPKAEDPAAASHTVSPNKAASAVSLDDFNRGENAAKEARKKKNNDKVKVSFLGSVPVGVAKLFLYIAFVALCSFFIVNTVINVGNDVFAFVKKDAAGNPVAELREDMNVTVNIPEGADTKKVAEILKDAGVIKYPGVFEKFAKFRISKRSYLTGKYLSGEVTVNPLMNYDTLINTLSDYERSVRGTVRITIPEGLTVNEILDLFEKNGVGKKSDFTDALQTHEYDFKFCKNLTKDNLSEYRFDTNYSYRLEGYLFPDTYDFYLNENPVSAINKLLVNFNKKFEEEFYARCDELGMTVDEVITLASMIEKEGNNAEDYYIISSVFHNRLKNKANFPYLNSDATLQYALAERSGPYGLDTSFDHPYNTYKYKGLPPGPICNPGTEAIYAALYPEKTSYYYFYTKRNGETVYSKTAEEHQNYINADKAAG